MYAEVVSCPQNYLKNVGVLKTDKQQGLKELSVVFGLSPDRLQNQFCCFLPKKQQPSAFCGQIWTQDDYYTEPEYKQSTAGVSAHVCQVCVLTDFSKSQ